ncbi:MAG: hypothetical protein R3F59_32435 [Myxococcota bacterium]
MDEPQPVRLGDPGQDPAEDGLGLLEAGLVSRSQSSSVGPSTKSITSAGLPSTVTTSVTGTMFGCRSAACSLPSCCSRSRIIGPCSRSTLSAWWLPSVLWRTR